MIRYKKSPIDILERAANYEYQDDREKFLNENMRPAIRILLTMVFNDQVTFPDYSDVQWKRNTSIKPGISDTNLDKEARKLYIFTEQFQKIDLKRKKAKLTQLLQALPAEEADFLLESIFKKKLPWRKIPKNFIEKKYPELLDEKVDFTE